MYFYKYIRRVKKEFRKVFSKPALPAKVVEHLKHNQVQVIDVGAGGRPVGTLLPYADHIDMYLCESAPESAQKLREKAQPWHSTTVIEKAIADRDGTATFYITKSASICSLLKPDAEELKKYEFYDHYGNRSDSDFDIVKEISIETTTLQRVIEEHRIKPYLIKLDTQGTELSILKTTDLSDVQVILTEIDFVRLYEDQNLFEEVDEYLRSQGFVLHKKSAFTADVRKDGKRVKIGGDACYYRP